MELLANGKVTLYAGDCLNVMAELPENSIDSICTDPPYHLISIVKRFGGNSPPPREALGAKGAFNRSSAGFMGKQWDGGDIAFQPATWEAAWRVLKPGGHMVAFSGTRTYHRMVCAIEDAGFEIRDQLAWVYGSGFPKSHDVSKGIDKHLFREWLDADPDRRAAFDKEIKKAKNLDAQRLIEDKWKAIGGFLRGVIATRTMPDIRNRHGQGGGGFVSNALADFDRPMMEHKVTQAATELAAQWEGWGTALKPAWEPIVLARKPLVGTVVENVLLHGVGGVHIDACRIDAEGETIEQSGEIVTTACHEGYQRPGASMFNTGKAKERSGPGNEAGRFPANLLHDGSPEVEVMFPETGMSTGRDSRGRSHQAFTDDARKSTRDDIHEGFGDSGSAARFFYSAKADGDDRLGSKHPTVKPVDLMQYLVRLVTPPGGTVLDCFAGTGTTGEAAFREGCKAVLIEREPEYQADIRRRMSLVMGGPDERKRESLKANGKAKLDAGPLFA